MRTTTVTIFTGRPLVGVGGVVVAVERMMYVSTRYFFRSGLFGGETDRLGLHSLATGEPAHEVVTRHEVVFG